MTLSPPFAIRRAESVHYFIDRDATVIRWRVYVFGRLVAQFHWTFEGQRNA